MTAIAKRRSFFGVACVAVALAAACDSFTSAEDGQPQPPTTTDAGSTSDAPMNPDDGPPSGCGDTSSDSRHCGRCGHDCLGGTCAVGKCQPVTLATAEREVPWLVADATRVIWSTGIPELGAPGGLFACPKAGCPSTGPTVLATSLFVGTLASTGTTAYVARVAGIAPGILQIGLTDITPLPALEKNALLWMHPRDGGVLANAFYENDAAAFARTIYRANVPGGPFDRVAEYAPTETVNTASTAFARDWVYLGAHNTPKIVAAPLAGGAFVEVVSGGDAYVWSMTADDDRVYFTSGGGGSTLYSCPANGQPCLPRLDLSPGEGITGKPRAVHFAAGRLFIQTSAGELVSCDPKACSGKVDLLATETAFDDRWRLSGTNIAVDAQAVYYVAREGLQEASFTYVVKRVARD